MKWIGRLVATVLVLALVGLVGYGIYTYLLPIWAAILYFSYLVFGLVILVFGMFSLRRDLQNAKLNGAGMLESNLQYADLTNANLEGAQFNEDVTFIQSKLNGADLTWATGLSFSQIKLAITDDKTRLPDYLEEEMDDDFLLQF